jgi:hypothetical protein
LLFLPKKSLHVRVWKGGTFKVNMSNAYSLDDMALLIAVAVCRQGDENFMIGRIRHQCAELRRAGEEAL